MQIEIGSTVVALGRYFGRVVEVVPVQSYDGYSVAVRVKFQREVEPSCGWFLGRDVQTTTELAIAEVQRRIDVVAWKSRQRIKAVIEYCDNGGADELLRVMQLFG